jgi:hypothetical protein
MKGEFNWVRYTYTQLSDGTFSWLRFWRWSRDYITVRIIFQNELQLLLNAHLMNMQVILLF